MITALPPNQAMIHRSASPFAEVDEVPEPPSATGQYPDEVWATVNYPVAQRLDQTDEVPEPPTATGQYPDEVWATVNYPVAQTVPEPAAETFLAFKEADYTDDIGTAPDPEQPSESTNAAVLDFQEMYRIIRAVAVADSGEALYTATAGDREYTTSGQPAYQQRQFGLAFGLVLFTQASGLLGKLLTIMQRRDPALFADIFRAEAQALLTVTNALTEPERLQPVAGQPLWSQAWMERFRLSGASPTFQAAQNEAAIEHQFRPMLRVAVELGFTSDRALAMVYDRVVTRGVGGGLRWVVQTAAPLRTAAQRTGALRMLGFETVAAFQQAAGWTPQDGQFDPVTHATLVGTLRRQGTAILPTTKELMERLITGATGIPKERLVRLRDSTQLEDITYRLSDELEQKS